MTTFLNTISQRNDYIVQQTKEGKWDHPMLGITTGKMINSV